MIAQNPCALGCVGGHGHSCKYCLHVPSFTMTMHSSTLDSKCRCWRTFDSSNPSLRLRFCFQDALAVFRNPCACLPLPWRSFARRSLEDCPSASSQVVSVHCSSSSQAWLRCAYYKRWRQRRRGGQCKPSHRRRTTRPRRPQGSNHCRTMPTARGRGEDGRL